MLYRIALFLAVFALLLAADSSVQGALNARINPSTGQVDLIALGDTTFVGYELSGPSGTKWFNTTTSYWNSLADQGRGSMFEFTTANPSISLSEGSLGSLAVTDDTVLSLGTPYVGATSVSAADFSFTWGNASNEPIVGSVSIVPEPSSIFLAMTAALGFLALRFWKGRRIHSSR